MLTMTAFQDFRESLVSLRDKIWQIFGPTIFNRPLFYSYPGGLRFELSEGGSATEQLRVALRKSKVICKDIFVDDHPIAACLRIYSDNNRFLHRRSILALKHAGINIPAERWLWSEERDKDDWCDESEPDYWLYLAFEASAGSLDALLTCALVKDLDLGTYPYCDLYLFNLRKGIVAFPYDDRGMDVVGPNTVALRNLYNAHHKYLLNYDRAIMEKTFGSVAKKYRTSSDKTSL